MLLELTNMAGPGKNSAYLTHKKETAVMMLSCGRFTSSSKLCQECKPECPPSHYPDGSDAAEGCFSRVSCCGQLHFSNQVDIASNARECVVNAKVLTIAHSARLRNLVCGVFLVVFTEFHGKKK